MKDYLLVSSERHAADFRLGLQVDVTFYIAESKFHLPAS